MSMFPTTQNASTDLSSMLANSQVTASQNSGGKAFIKFNFENGNFSFGRDQVDITGDRIVVNITSFHHGWTIWSNQVPHKTSVHFTQAIPPAPAAIGKDSPSEARSFEARFEDDDETVLDFSTNSYGGRQGADALLDAIKVRAAHGEEEFLFPVVTLDSTNYSNKHRGGKTTFNPAFTVVGWVNGEGDAEGKKKKAIVKEVVVEEEVVEEAPKRRRRKPATA